MPPLNDQSNTGKRYWRSLDQLADSPEYRKFAENEFPNYNPEEVRSPNRREFMKLMAASAALAGGIAGCRRWPEYKLAPYADRPADYVPGQPEYYATSMQVGGVAKPLLAQSVDGRPIKIEGNPSHPMSLGACDSNAQGSVLDLYHPYRNQYVTYEGSHHHKGRALGYADFIRAARRTLKHYSDKGGEGVAVLCEATGSPTLTRVQEQFLQQYPNARWYEYETVNRDNEIAGTRIAFGQPLRPQLNLENARGGVIVGFDSDFLMGHPNSIRYARDYAETRRSADEGVMSRFYMVESTHSLTGSNADHRLPLPSSEIPGFVKHLAAELFHGKRLHVPRGAGEIREALSKVGEHPTHSREIRRLAEDLLQHRGSSVLTAGPNQPAEVHALVHLLNAALGAVGKTVEYTDFPGSGRPTHLEQIQELTARMHRGEVRALFILGGNPVYNAPVDLRFAEALEKVDASVHLSRFLDETSVRCTWHVPRSHYLEAWGDARAWNGMVSIVQPLIRPLYGGRSIIETLTAVMGEAQAAGYNLVRQTHRKALAQKSDLPFEEQWRVVLHRGLIEGTAYSAVHVRPQGGALRDALERLAASESAPGALELTFQPHPSVYDGRFAPNGWLQELPHPMTKLTWDNALLVAPATARDLGVSRGEIVRIRVGEFELEAAVEILPGQAPGSLSIDLGYGREVAGHIGTGLGFNAYAVRTAQAMARGAAVGVSVEKTGRWYELVSVQSHHAIDSLADEELEQRVARDPALIREASLDYYEDHPNFVEEYEHHIAENKEGVPLQLWEHPVEFEEIPYQWGMTIDQNVCIGCSACMIACQAENNVPIVGKTQVALGREMHWIRVDRYFVGEESDPQTRYQPMACQHCENAPCEAVCPVAATVHDSHGLNVMVYNRCIGTRYCSNNCPYKVRRFNWYNWHTHDPRGGWLEPPHLGFPDTEMRQYFSQPEHRIEQMRFNPEVTVRMRGVMEKCTFCIQRIKAHTIPARIAGRKVEDGEITPACAQTCPTNAITFGNLQDPEARVTKLQQHPRSYALLKSLNTRPRNLFLATITNPGEPDAEGGNGHGQSWPAPLEETHSPLQAEHHG